MAVVNSAAVKVRHMHPVESLLEVPLFSTFPEIPLLAAMLVCL